jgi:hypothetical protein
LISALGSGVAFSSSTETSVAYQSSLRVENGQEKSIYDRPNESDVSVDDENSNLAQLHVLFEVLQMKDRHYIFF